MDYFGRILISVIVGDKKTRAEKDHGNEKLEKKGARRKVCRVPACLARICEDSRSRSYILRWNLDIDPGSHLYLLTKLDDVVSRLFKNSYV